MGGDSEKARRVAHTTTMYRGRQPAMCVVLELINKTEKGSEGRHKDGYDA